MAVCLMRTSPGAGASTRTVCISHHVRSAMPSDDDRRSFHGADRRGDGDGGWVPGCRKAAFAEQKSSDRLKSGFENVVCNKSRKSLLVGSRRIEARPPFPKTLPVAGHRTQPYGGMVIPQHHWRLDDAISEARLDIGEGQQLLANTRSVVKAEIAHGADQVARSAILQPARADRGMPGLMTVEIAQDRPHLFDRGFEDGAAAHFNHRPSTSEPALQRSQSRAKYIVSDICSDLFFPDGLHVEFGRPFHECLVAVGCGETPLDCE